MYIKHDKIYFLFDPRLIIDTKSLVKREDIARFTVKKKMFSILNVIANILIREPIKARFLFTRL